MDMHKSRVVLINPSENMPYGLMYIAGYLRKANISVSIQNHPYIKGEPWVVGISSMFTVDAWKVKMWAEYIKTIHPDTTVVLGGNHASTNAEELIKLPYVDKVVVGEGEYAMWKIACGSQGKIYRESNLLIDCIPIPAYDLVDVEKYITEGVNPFSMRKRTMAIISSRGCPNDCAYCSIKAVWGRSWRGRSPQLVVDEIEYLQKTYDVHEFSFLDDSISIDAKRLEGMCKEIIKRNLKIKWTTPNGIAHWTLTNHLLSSMKESGCYRITFGIESGSPKIRKYIGKDYSLEQATGLINYGNRIGLWTITTNIIGLPYEDVADINATLDYAISCGTDLACFYELIPHQGTRIADDVDKITLSNLGTWQRMMYREFLFSRILTAPFRLARKIRSWEDFLYACKLVKMGWRILLRTFKKKGHVLYG